MEKEIQAMKNSIELNRWGLRHEDETGCMPTVGKTDREDILKGVPSGDGVRLCRRQDLDKHPCMLQPLER